MFQKFLSVVGGERKDAVVPTLGVAQSRDQVFHLLIDPSDARVVKGYHFITMPVRGAWARDRNDSTMNSGTAPGAAKIPRIPHKVKRFRLRIIRGVRIHQMEPEKEGRRSNICEPRASVLDHNVGRWEAA